MYPSPLGESSTTNDSVLGTQVLMDVVVEIVPVRIVNSNALLVTVTNFPGMPPPLPGQRTPAQPPPLPSMRAKEPAGPKNPFDKKFAVEMGRNVLGGSITGALGTFAGAASTFAPAALALAPVLAGFTEVVSPLLGAAHGGFQTGMHKNSGAEALGKSFEFLGQAVGLMMLPAVLEFAGAAKTAADELNENKGLQDKISAGAGPAWWGRERRDRIGNRILGPIWREGKRQTGADEAERKSLQNELKLITAMKQSVGGVQPSYQGVADVRSQAQLAALQSPLERELLKQILDNLTVQETNTSKRLQEISDHTNPGR